MDNDIGLRRGSVQLRAHNSEWAKLFEEERKLLLGKFPHVILEIQHGGSTAIPTIPAKPIIDMFAVVPSLQAAEAIKGELVKLGYEYRGADGVAGRVLYVKGAPEKRTHHLQLVERENDEWGNHILIREYFLKHPDVAQEYAKLKILLAEKYPEDRKAYSHGKDIFIKSVIQKAKTKQ